MMNICKIMKGAITSYFRPLASIKQIIGIDMSEQCWICKKQKGQPPDRCNGHYGLDEPLVVGVKYNFINQPERLIYLGNNFSGNGYWHQFAKVETPQDLWCELLDSDLVKIEKTVISEEQKVINDRVDIEFTV